MRQRWKASEEIGKRHADQPNSFESKYTGKWQLFNNCFKHFASKMPLQQHPHTAK
ncbi:hypothetical protein SynBIOSU31_00227 [Synechococcus sp. BIOS-U3-1]|nr:hypothetical protein SynBIOSU31_00227 [Synechococcus sp. BIOS-U3-1]